MRHVVYLLLLLFIAPCAPAQAAVRSSDIELERVIIDQTRTRAGSEFAQRLCLLWGEMPGLQVNYTVLVRELPGPQASSIIAVELNDIPVYRSTLKTRGIDAVDGPKTAVENAQMLLLQLEELLASTGEPVEVL